MKEKIREELKKLEDNDITLCEELIRDKGVKDKIFAEVAFKNKIYRPSILYKYASNEIRDKLIELLENDDEIESLNVNGILMALAEIGDENVFKAFNRWKEHPKKWRKNIYVEPLDYAFEGGWCIENEKYKKLTYNKCFAIKEKSDTNKAHITIGGISN